MSKHYKIETFSRRLRYTLYALLGLVPALTVFFWLNVNSLPEFFPVNLPVSIDRELSIGTRLLALLVSGLPLALKMVGILTLIRLFRLYERGVIFSEDNVACFRRLGKLLILWFFCVPVYQLMLSFCLTFQNPPGERVIAFGLGSADATVLIAGMMVLVISWVMDEGRALEDEQAYTV